MRLRNAAVAIVVLAVTTVFAQGTPPSGTSLTRQRNAPVPRRGMTSADGSAATAAQTPAMLRQRMEDMQGTLAKMHAVLQQMRAKAVNGGAKDSLTTANLDMWELMLGHLDKQFEELRATTLAREDLDARRAALYKQADAKAALAVKNAQEAGAGPAAATADHGPAPSPAAANAAAPVTPPTQSAPAASSQN